MEDLNNHQPGDRNRTKTVQSSILTQIGDSTDPGSGLSQSHQNRISVSNALGSNSTELNRTEENLYEVLLPHSVAQGHHRTDISMTETPVPVRSSLSTRSSEIDELTNLLMNSLRVQQISFGICSRCGEEVVGEGMGCTAMGQVFHINCLKCSTCQCSLQGRPFFYHVDGKPYCESDYRVRLEKCCVCGDTVIDRILRANGKAYHPNCFSCVICFKRLEGIQFTIDAKNRIYCIQDFHKKFAPRCSVCQAPILPESGQEETVRVVALDRSFHLACYKCEDCGLLLRSEAEGRGCYPLDGHVLCKNCNARRVRNMKI